MIQNPIPNSNPHTSIPMPVTMTLDMIMSAKVKEDNRILDRNLIAIE